MPGGTATPWTAPAPATSPASTSSTPPDELGTRVVGDLKPWTGKGISVNMINFDEMDRVVEAFGGPEKYARLGRVKAQYDPENLFRMNYNITPRPETALFLPDA